VLFSGRRVDILGERGRAFSRTAAAGTVQLYDVQRELDGREQDMSLWERLVPRVWENLQGNLPWSEGIAKCSSENLVGTSKLA
jgi:hypothetical protein